MRLSTMVSAIRPVHAVTTIALAFAILFGVRWQAPPRRAFGQEPTAGGAIAPASSGTKPAAASDPFAAPSNVGERRELAPGETAIVGVTIELDGKPATATEGVIFHADDKRAYIGVTTIDAAVHGVSLLEPATPRFHIVVPDGLTQKKVPAEFTAWRQYASVLVLAAPKNELPAPLKIEAKSSYVDGSQVRFHALRMTKTNDDFTFTRTLHPGTLKGVQDQTRADRVRFFADVEIAALVGAPLPMGIVATLDGTPLGRSVRSTLTAGGRTVYECAGNGTLVRFRGPEVDQQILEPTVGHDGLKVTVDCKIGMIDPLRRIKMIKAVCRLAPFKSKSAPAGIKLEYPMVLKPGGQRTMRPRHHSKTLPEVEATNWNAHMEFENYRGYKYSGDETGQLRISWTYEDVDGGIYEFMEPTIGRY